jgi:hypothetical protein
MARSFFCSSYFTRAVFRNCNAARSISARVLTPQRFLGRIVALLEQPVLVDLLAVALAQPAANVVRNHVAVSAMQRVQGREHLTAEEVAGLGLQHGA